MKKWISALLALCLLVVGLVASAPTKQAEAVTSWPMKLENTRATNVLGFDDGSFSAVACASSYPNSVGVTYFDKEGQKRNTLSGPSSSELYCDGEYDQEFADGTIYATRKPTATTTELVAWKNGRHLWTFDSTSTTKCNLYGTSYIDKQMLPASTSEGIDGNIYMILSSGYDTPNCDDRLVGLNKNTGVLLFDKLIGKGPGPNSGLGSIQPQAWTYNNKIVVVDRGGMIREFNYTGIEDTGAQYQFPIPSGHNIGHVRANKEGTVFAMTRATWVIGYATLLYHKDDGTTNSIVDTYSVYGGISRLYLTGDGSVVGIEPSTRRVDRFNLSTNSVTSSNLANTSTYTVAELSGYVEDASGNALVAWSYNSNSGANQAISVDEIAVGTGARTNLLFEESVSTGSNGPSLYPFGYMIDRSIADRNLYIPVCRSGAATCFSGNVVPDIWIYKAELSGFGTALRNDYDRNDYESTELEYVAMGDSYSSGEGIEPFLSGTDKSSQGENKCHRSQAAYPLLLEGDTGLDLNLTAFVACSGAITSNITGTGQWGEPSQLDALSESTDVVTLTIGGNDIGFESVLTACSRFNTPPSNWIFNQDTYDEYICLNAMEDAEGKIYGTTLLDGGVTLKQRLDNVLQSVKGKVGAETKIFIIGYPYLLPTYENIQGSCQWGRLMDFRQHQQEA